MPRIKKTLTTYNFPKLYFWPEIRQDNFFSSHLIKSFLVSYSGRNSYGRNHIRICTFEEELEYFRKSCSQCVMKFTQKAPQLLRKCRMSPSLSGSKRPSQPGSRALQHPEDQRSRTKSHSARSRMLYSVLKMVLSVFVRSPASRLKENVWKPVPSLLSV